MIVPGPRRKNKGYLGFELNPKQSRSQVVFSTIILQLRSVDEDARRSRQAFTAEYEARELHRQEAGQVKMIPYLDTDVQCVSRVHVSVSILSAPVFT